MRVVEDIPEAELLVSRLVRDYRKSTCLTDSQRKREKLCRLCVLKKRNRIAWERMSSGIAETSRISEVTRWEQILPQQILPPSLWYRRLRDRNS